MELPSSKNNPIESELETVRSAAMMLQKLLEDLHESSQTEDAVDYNSVTRFRIGKKDTCNSFGYELEENQASKSYISYRKNRLRHKLARIQKEFEFVKNNMPSYRQLTPREKEIIQLLARGKNNPKIAECLCISRSTVEQHRKHINHKLKIESFSQLMHFSYAFDLV